MSVDVDTIKTTTVRPVAAHVAALGKLRTQADKIRYACEQVPVATTTTVREWLAVYGLQASRSHTSTVVNSWRREHGLESTGEMAKLTPALLAELDGIGANAAAALEPQTEVSEHPANAFAHVSEHRPDTSAGMAGVFEQPADAPTGVGPAVLVPTANGVDVSGRCSDTRPDAFEHPADLSGQRIEVSEHRPDTPRVFEHPRPERADVPNASTHDGQQKQVSTWVFVLGSLVGLVVSVDTSWRFFGEKLGVTNIPERIAMFAGMEIVLIACGVAMFEGVRRRGGPGPARWLAWALCGASAYAALSLSGPFLGAARVMFGPILSVVALHFALGVELRARGNRRTGTLARIGRELRERWLSRFGLADDDRDALTRTRDRAARRAAQLALAPGWTPLRQSRLNRHLRKSNAAHDPDARDRLLAELAAIRHASDLRTLAQASPWTAS